MLYIGAECMLYIGAECMLYIGAECMLYIGAEYAVYIVYYMYHTMYDLFQKATKECSTRMGA